MRKNLIIPVLVCLSFISFVQSQSVSGNYTLNGVTVAYTNVARDIDSPDDSIATYFVSVGWPGVSVSPYFTDVLNLPIKVFAVGDTIATPVAPLVTPELLQMYGIVLNLQLDQDAGGFQIPGDPENFPYCTYPTTSTVNCSTYAVVAPVTDNGTFYLTGPIYDQEAGTMTYGFGITYSEIFDWFLAIPLDQLPDPSTWPESDYGLMIGHFSDDYAAFDTLEIIWRSTDGPTSDSGIDTEGHLNRHMGISVLDGDTVTVAALKQLVAMGVYTPTTPLNVGSSPILGGEGIDLDFDGEPDGIVEDLNFGYLFDPTGRDGELFNGDEPFQFTGYYLTYNFMVAAGTFKATFEANLESLVAYFMGQGMDQVSATVAAADSSSDLAAQAVATLFGADAATASAIGAQVGTAVSTELNAYLQGGGTDLEGAIVSAVEAAAVTAVGGLAAAGISIDDSDHDCTDYSFIDTDGDGIPDSPYSTTGGRLIVEVNNVCIPDLQTRDVHAIFTNTAYVISVDSDVSTVPDKFALHQNYPNPFNPETKISFDLPIKEQVAVTILNVLGQEVRTLYSGKLSAGIHSLVFDGRDDHGNQLPSGIYIYRVKAGNFNSTRKMMLLK